MKIFFLLFTISWSPLTLATPQVPLPNVQEEAKKALDAVKEVNPIADCIKPSMFSSQSPLQSSKQIGGCVSNKLKTLELPDSSEVDEHISDLKSGGAGFLNKIKSCWQSFEALKNCFSSNP